MKTYINYLRMLSFDIVVQVLVWVTTHHYRFLGDIPYLQVLTRRQQLQLNQDAKTDKSKGEGRGGGRGRGRGRGKAKSKVPPTETEMDAVVPKGVVGEGEGAEPMQTTPPRAAASSKGKRAALSTPDVKRQLFKDPEDQDGKPLSGLDPNQSPAVKQPKKRVKKAKKAKALPEGDGLPPTEEPAPKTKPARRVRSKAPQPPQPAAESAQPAHPSQPSEPLQPDGKEEEEDEKPKRPPGKNAQKVALLHMQEAKADPAEWMHVQHLVKAMDDKYTCKADTPRFNNWSFSMYWKTNRVGVLQKREGVHVHVVSFGTTFTQHIGMSVKAARMYVGSLVAYPTGSQSSTLR